jgi:hypothetical protein
LAESQKMKPFDFLEPLSLQDLIGKYASLIPSPGIKRTRGECGVDSPQQPECQPVQQPRGQCGVGSPQQPECQPVQQQDEEADAEVPTQKKPANCVCQ